MSTLTEFLLERIAEDEAVAAAAREHEFLSSARDASPLRWAKDHLGYGSVFVNSGRVLAECEAKRRIVELHEPGVDSPCVSECYSGDNHGCETLKTLALPYADHAAYREEWKP